MTPIWPISQGLAVELTFPIQPTQVNGIQNFYMQVYAGFISFVFSGLMELGGTRADLNENVVDILQGVILDEESNSEELL